MGLDAGGFVRKNGVKFLSDCCDCAKCVWSVCHAHNRNIISFGALVLDFSPLFKNSFCIMSKIIVKQDIRKDAWNWWDACNKISFGVDWKQRINNKKNTR